MKLKILVVDDHVAILKAIERVLEAAGYQVLTAHDGIEALGVLQSQPVDMVLADIAMPNMNGYQLYEQVRKNAQWMIIPFVFLTARVMDSDIRYGKRLGVDDYLTKPIDPEDLLATVQGKLRRAEQLVQVCRQPTRSQQMRASAYSDGYLTIDLKNRRVLVHDEPVKLTPTEYRLLAYLFENAGRTLSFRQILETVWGWEYQDSVDYVHVYISHLRRKLEKDPRHPEYLLTEHGVGYWFEKLSSK